MFEDKKIICKSCGKEFIFTDVEQEFYKNKWFVAPPKRCRSCRSQKRWQRSKASVLPKHLYDIICSKCGRHAKIPYRLYDKKPVYCPDCYKPKSIEMGLPIKDR